MALLSDLSYLDRVEKEKERIEAHLNQAPLSIVLKCIPRHDNTPDTWWCQYREEIYMRTNENCEKPMQQVRYKPTTAMRMHFPKW